VSAAPWDALVVGAGPAGAAAAHWLADSGHRVLVVEKKRFPREKTCGDGLTPLLVGQPARDHHVQDHVQVAAATAARFNDIHLGGPLPEPPLT